MNSVATTIENKAKSSTFKNSVCDEQLQKIGMAKDPIKRRVQFNLAKKEKFRVIESKDKRIVHYMFNSGLPSIITSFSRKFSRMLDGTLASKKEEETALFKEYIEKMQADELTPEDENPIKYEDSPYQTFELGTMSRLCFSTADDPFYKAPISKFYPEAIVFDSHGEIIARVGPECKKADDVQMNYMDDFRDPALKVNDDRQGQISLNAITKPGTMILLVIKENDLTGKPVKDADFERAWFRLSNEETIRLSTSVRSLISPLKSTTP